MEITVSKKQGRVPVSILHINGKLDGASYQQLIDEARKLYDGGARDLLLDLGQCPFMSSAGIAALHKTALLFRGAKQATDEEGWASLRAIDRDRDSGVQQHLKLLNPSEKLVNVLELVGLKSMFEIHADLDQAVASF